MSSNTQQQNYYKNTLSNGSVEQKERVWKPRNDYRNNRGGNGQRSFQRHQNYNGNNNQRYNNSYKRGGYNNNQRYNDSYRRGGYNKRPTNKGRRIVDNKDGWSTIKGSNNNRRFNKVSNYPNKPKKENNKFNLLNETSKDKFKGKNVPKVTKSKPVLQGSWGKGISKAVKEDVKFEKQVQEKEKDNGMVTLSKDLLTETNTKTNTIYKPVYLFKPLGDIKWGDEAMDEDEEYNDDNESDNDSVSSYNTSDDDNEYNYGY